MESLLFHPKLVHVPMALGVLMPLVAGGLLLAWWRKWLPARSWVMAVALQAVLVGSGVLALRSGEVDEERVEHVVSERLIEAHEEAAEVFVGASAAVLAVMLLALAAKGRDRADTDAGDATGGAEAKGGAGGTTGRFRGRGAGSGVALAAAAAATFGTFVVLGLGYRTGQAGGELVYRHGAALAYAGGSAAAGSAAAESATLDRGRDGGDKGERGAETEKGKQRDREGHEKDDD